MIYFDNGATTYPKPEEVYQAIDQANRIYGFNAGRGSYKEANQTGKMIDETRQMMADLVSVSSDAVSFESSATEALNLIINGIDWHDGDSVYISPFEHNAVVRPLFNIKKKVNININLIPFDKRTWELEADQLSDMFALQKPRAVFVSHVSNVTGYILPYEEIFKLAKQYNAITVLDSSQSLGIIEPKIKDADFIIFAGHKSLYTTFGVAGFINTGSVKLDVVKSGGTGSDSLNHDMPEEGHGRYEAGSSNSVAIAGLNAALKWRKTVDAYTHEKELTEYLINSIKNVDGVHIYVPAPIHNIFGIVSFDVDGYTAADVGSILADEYDICVRTGYHCSPFVHEFIGSLKYSGTVRASLSVFSNKAEIDQLITALETL